MSITQEKRNGIRHLARYAATVLFVLIVATGHTISPQVEGTADMLAVAEERGIAEPEFLPSDCAVDGLVFANCNLDF